MPLYNLGETFQRPGQAAGDPGTGDPSLWKSTVAKFRAVLTEGIKKQFPVSMRVLHENK